MKLDKRVLAYLDFSSINFGRSILTIAVSTYILYYYTDVLLLPLEIVPVLLLICRFFDGAIDPVIGFYMDRRHSKLGKYRGYIVLWALPACILHVAIFSPPPLTGMTLIIYCFVAYLLWALSHSIIECAHNPMLITISDDPGERRAANTARISMGIIGAMAASYLPLVLVDKLGNGSERYGFTLAMIVFALVALATILPGALRLKEHNVTRDSSLSVKQTVSLLLSGKMIPLLIVMYLCSQIGNSAKTQATIYYMKYTLDRADLIAIVMLVGVFSSFLTQPFIVWAAKHVKLLTLMLAGYISSCLACVVIGISGQSITLFFVGNILFGIASAFPGNLIHVHMANLAGVLSKENSVGGFAVSLMGLCVRLGQSLGTVVISWVLYSTGYVPNEAQSPMALTGLWLCLCGLPFLTYSVAGVAAFVSRRVEKVQ